jgi:uracil-DNA glycosylase
MSVTVQELVKAKGYKWVFPRGDPNSPVWVCGEAPGGHEEAEGFAFVGPSGKEQNKMLYESGFLKPEKLFFCNPYSVRPPDNKMDRFDELGIPRKEFEDEFLETLRKFRPKIIVPVGETSAKFLCPDTVPKRKSDDKGYIHKWMGSLLRSPLLQWDHYVIPNLHPAYILRNWGERVVACLVYGKAYEEAEYHRVHGSLQVLPRRTIKHKLTSDQVL